MGGGGSKKVTIGYKYFVGMHMVFCETPDAVLQINVGDKTAWTGTVTQTTRSLGINQPDLFGGEKKEGGVVGEIDVEFGDDAQTPNPYLLSKLPGAENGIPAFRGVLGLVLRQCYVSAMNPYIKKWDVKVKRLPAKGWYDAKADIGGHANPAHIIYEIITENSIGEIDDTGFRQAADKLYSEGFGLSFIWKGGSIQSFIDEIVNHIGAILYVSPTTGKFNLKLIRDDYDIATIPVFDETNIISLDDYQRRTLTDTINEITVNYIDAETGKESSVTIQDIANIQAQGQVVEDKRDYLGIPTAQLAYKVAQRDLMSGAALLGKVTLKVNRTAYSLTPGDVFVFKWDALGINQMVLRAVEIDYGTLQDGTITIKAVEDVFSLSDAVFTEVQTPYWIDPVTDPQPCAAQKALEATYWDVKRALDAANFDYLPADAGYIVAVAARSNGIETGYQMHIDDGAGYENNGDFVFAPACAIVNDITETDTIIDFVDIADMDLAEAGDTVYAWLGDEAVRIDNIDLVNKKITIGRGCIDTVPKKHSAGTIMIFAGTDWYSYGQKEYTAGESVNVKSLPETGKGVLDISQAIAMNVILDSRIERPYPPAHVMINNVLYPELSVADLTVTWYHRDKTQQDAILIDDSMGNIGPETGTTYSIEIKRQDTGAQLYSATNIVSNSNVITNNEIGYEGDIIAEVWSVLNGYESWQRQQRVFLYLRQQPLATEDGEILTTETGEYILMEG